MTNNIAVLYTTIGTQQEAEQLANIMISQKLAACINIIPGGQSIYLWDGKIEQSAECYMLFKTTIEAMQELEQFIIQNHPYDVPAILKLAPESSEKFANYISKSVWHNNVKSERNSGEIVLKEDGAEDIKTKLQFELREYNRPFLGKYERKNFAAYIPDHNCALIAGISGFIIIPHQTMRLELVWVDEAHRKKGLGSKLFEYIEQYAIAKHCKEIQVSTGKWQGQAFYEKMGYEIVGIIPKWFCDQDEIFLVKRLEL
ncbi:divalent cation tolerance protein CutA [Holospora curviuscula]|uniref:Divalent-cation tolerance protein CutA n=1 Tax=Holospora curviuscula TaxID=1082868 RepID=A0A2S5R7Y0_9PROT|nr:divalent cation tolerance protein CutA [Holospora curviuscula]PPE03410.1 Divalent-cation tolerance protein CutA [Holospora curviuscula]